MEALLIFLGLAAVICIHLGLSARRKHMRELKRIKSTALRQQRAFVNDLLRQENAAKARGLAE